VLGLIDYGVMNGLVELVKVCKKYDVKLLFGFEVYFVDDCCACEVKVECNYLMLLVVDDEGFWNFVKLLSVGFFEGL